MNFAQGKWNKKRQKTHPSVQYKSTWPITVDIQYMKYCVPLYIQLKVIWSVTSVMLIFKRKNQPYIRYGFPIGSIPIMLKSNNWTLFRKSQSEIAKAKECPNDCGG